MSNKIDLTNQKFGNLMVLYDSGERKDRQIIWHCKCDCGNECNVKGYNLRIGKTKSCGCARNKDKKINLIGQTFGKLTILSEAIERKNKHIYWHCRCECGNELDVYGGNLTSGKSTSCGKCNRGNDLIDQKFGRLTVIEKTNKRSSGGSIIWKCKCECGNECEARGDSLKRGETQSCGCLKSKGEEKISQILRQNNINFEQQKVFNDCYFTDTNGLAKFDFYVNNKYIIEYDGEQHFKSTESGWNTKEHLIKTQKHDTIKNQYCKEHNILIIRIPYTHVKNLSIQDLIPETSQFLVQ